LSFERVIIIIIEPSPDSVLLSFERVVQLDKNHVVSPLSKINLTDRPDFGKGHGVVRSLG
jgi:hypothetical protein